MFKFYGLIFFFNNVGISIKGVFVNKGGVGGTFII